MHLALRQFFFPPAIALCFLIILGASLFVACTPQERANPGDAWDYSDLRTLSIPDQDTSPGDFIAGYSRVAGSDLQLRFDFLEMDGYLDNDYYIALDYQPGGSYEIPIQSSTDIAWDSLLYLPAQGLPQAFSPLSIGKSPGESGNLTQESDQEAPVPRIVRIPWQDYILVSLNQAFLPDLEKGINIQAFSTSPGSVIIRDAIGPFNSAASQPEQAPVLLTFWNTFPAFSPAQALRKWDGAHTGPYGERHGLAILLENVRRYAVPAVLLDLRTPPVLSALDYLDAIPLVKELHSRKLLTLPDSLPGSPSFPLFPDGLPEEAPQYYLDRAQDVSEDFDLPPSNFLYLPRNMDEPLPGYSHFFSPADQSAQFPPHISLPPQIPDEPQATSDGLSLTIRRNLINHALERDAAPTRYPVLILGGSLQDSAFGDPAASAAAMSYIANHPWIKPLNSDELRSLPHRTEFQYLPGTTPAASTGDFSPSPLLTLLPEPDSSPDNPLLQEAWDSAYSLYSALPPEPRTLSQLRTNYTGQPGILLAAAQWAEDPYTTLDCQSDIDLDGIPECLLASENQFAVVDLLGGRLIAYFYRQAAGVHQVVAPTAQVIVGLGDPSTWLLDAVDGADPSGIHGAFSDSSPPWPLYSYSTGDSSITFNSPDQQVEKTFSLMDNGLNVSYHSAASLNGFIPIAMDPWQRFTPGWSEHYLYSPVDNGYHFSINDHQVVQVVSDIPLGSHGFTDSLGLAGVPEDPNYDYPRGHYLPFPFVVLEYRGSGEFEFIIKTLN